MRLLKFGVLASSAVTGKSLFTFVNGLYFFLKLTSSSYSPSVVLIFVIYDNVKLVLYFGYMFVRSSMLNNSPEFCVNIRIWLLTHCHTTGHWIRVFDADKKHQLDYDFEVTLEASHGQPPSVIGQHSYHFRAACYSRCGGSFWSFFLVHVVALSISVKRGPLVNSIVIWGPA